MKRFQCLFHVTSNKIFFKQKMCYQTRQKIILQKYWLKCFTPDRLLSSTLNTVKLETWFALTESQTRRETSSLHFKSISWGRIISYEDCSDKMWHHTLNSLLQCLQQQYRGGVTAKSPHCNLTVPLTVDAIFGLHIQTVHKQVFHSHYTCWTCWTLLGEETNTQHWDEPNNQKFLWTEAPQTISDHESKCWLWEL